MGNESLQPELKEELKTLKLTDDFLDQVKNAYCDRLKVKYRCIKVMLKFCATETKLLWSNNKHRNEGLFVCM